MATPTPSGSLPQKHHTIAAHSASTPTSSAHHAHNFTSPAPRSVPSPAANRTQAGRSPLNHPTHVSSAHHHSTTGSTGGPRGLLGSSPAAHLLNIDSPAAFGFPLGGEPMKMSMSGISFDLPETLGGPLSDADWERQVEATNKTIATRPGKICEEALEKLGKGLGFGILWETKNDGTRQLVMATDTLLVEVDFKDNNIQKVNVEFPASSAVVNAHARTMSEVMFKLLRLPPGWPAFSSTLMPFMENFYRLALMDKLGGPSFNGFDAISGVYVSLNRLFEHEKRALQAAMGTWKPGKIEREVLCHKSGRPRWNACKTVGLGLDYWMANRLDLGYEKDLDIFFISIECQESAPELYTSARISNDWVSADVEKAPDAADPNEIFNLSTIDWQDPPPSYLSSSADTADGMSMADLGVGKLPNVRFVAKLKPPIALPYNEAMRILQLVNVVNMPIDAKVGLLEDLILHGKDAQVLPPDALPAQEVRKHTYKRNVPVVFEENGEPVLKYMPHDNVLFAPKPEYGFLLEEFPFVHPRQLVEILPTLRQYAALQYIIRKSFCDEPDKDDAKEIPAFRSDDAVFNVDVTLAAVSPPKLLVTSPHPTTSQKPKPVLEPQDPPQPSVKHTPHLGLRLRDLWSCPPPGSSPPDWDTLPWVTGHEMEESDEDEDEDAAEGFLEDMEWEHTHPGEEPSSSDKTLGAETKEEPKEELIEVAFEIMQNAAIVVTGQNVFATQSKEIQKNIARPIDCMGDINTMIEFLGVELESGTGVSKDFLQMLKDLELYDLYKPGRASHPAKPRIPGPTCSLPARHPVPSTMPPALLLLDTRNTSMPLCFRGTIPTTTAPSSSGLPAAGPPEEDCTGISKEDHTTILKDDHVGTTMEIQSSLGWKWNMTLAF
ncbi:hypothetical protein K402DRAFT_458351 [Aulographum hederae CBS 113979]|uniref:Mediator of RNA polymerase II transcription subunit 1 n=1 Tax=Aulographum hederae CBS 113979 TaxID=1176131 RepID=A0A6G1GJ79_9PEZI|nr:hypothetical protein K402DRAFT_458351 [Aulographum hederae CBS 113979]